MQSSWLPGWPEEPPEAHGPLAFPLKPTWFVIVALRAQCVPAPAPAIAIAVVVVVELEVAVLAAVAAVVVVKSVAAV